MISRIDNGFYNWLKEKNQKTKVPICKITKQLYDNIGYIDAIIERPDVRKEIEKKLRY
jgi:hypothetical protein